jgi:hypothetical protein
MLEKKVTVTFLIPKRDFEFGERSSSKVFKGTATAFVT